MSKQSLNGAAFKLQTLINFHVGDTINSMTKASLFTGGADVLVYTTLMGGLGALLPFASRFVFASTARSCCAPAHEFCLLPIQRGR
jgi:hypothetical protein